MCAAPASHTCADLINQAGMAQLNATDFTNLTICPQPFNGTLVGHFVANAAVAFIAGRDP